MNLESFRWDPICNIRITTLIVGVCNVGFTAHSFYSESASEEAYLAAVIICFSVSCLWVLATISGLISQQSVVSQKADIILHWASCIFSGISMVFYFVSLVENGNNLPYFWERVVVFVLGNMSIVLYGHGGYKLYKA